MADTPTWMAGHAKLVAVYAKPFWREAGLSGDAISRRGPLMEIHDASPAGVHEGALFGFPGVPAEARRQHRDAIVEASLAQLGRLFGPDAATPRGMLFMDWATEPATAATPMNMRAATERHSTFSSAHLPAVARLAPRGCERGDGCRTWPTGRHTWRRVATLRCMMQTYAAPQWQPRFRHIPSTNPGG